MKIVFSDEAQWLIRSLKEFNEQECIDWYIKTQLVIGSHGVLEYIKLKDTEKRKQQAIAHAQNLESQS